MEDDINIIKSLIAISSGGLALERIQREFREMNGSPLQFSKYGFRSLAEMLQSSNEITLQYSPTGIICHVNDEKMSHVTSLVNRTKKPTKKKKACSKPRSSYYNPSRGYSASPNRFTVRRGSECELNRRQPFQPVNRMRFDDRRRTAPLRPQAASRCPSTSSNTSSMKQYSQNTYGKSNGPSACKFERNQRNEPKPVQSNSVGSTVGKQPKTSDDAGSGWSSDSSEHNQQPCTPALRSVVGKTQADVKLLKSTLGDKTVQVSKGSIKSSASDWSSLDSGSASSQTDISKKTKMPPVTKCSSIPLQNGAVSSTSKLNPQLKNGPESSSEWSDSSERDKHQSSLGSSKPYSSGIQRVTLRGGCDRGKAHHQVNADKPGNNRVKTCQLQSPLNDIVVTGSPSKRVTSTTMKNGASTILVKVPNAPTVANPKLQEVNLKSILANYQFIGDFFLHSVAEATLGSKFPQHGGLCRSHLSIHEAIDEIHWSPGRSRRPVILMIGMTDILEGATFDEMKERTTLLLEELSHRHIVLLTLPVPPSFIGIGFERKLSVLEKYNKWLLNLHLPRTIETERYLYCDAPFYTRVSRSQVETFSDAGCWVVYDEIIEVIR